MVTSELKRTAPRENWETFEARLLSYFPEERDQFLINFAYDIAKKAHHGQARDSGERVFEHPRGATLIGIDECRERDVAVVIGTFLHDVGEDSIIFGHIKNQPYAEWRKTAKARCALIFGDEVADILIAVTNPVVDDVEILNHAQAHAISLENLRSGPTKAIIVKMYDRLHNLRELGFKPKEKQREKIAETRRDYYPIFELARGQFPEKTAHLLEQMEIAIKALGA